MRTGSWMSQSTSSRRFSTRSRHSGDFVMDTYAAFFVISAIGIMYAMVSLAITKRFGNRERVKQIQKEISDITKKQQAAIKKNDEAELKRLEAENARIPALLKESM